MRDLSQVESVLSDIYLDLCRLSAAAPDEADQRYLKRHADQIAAVTDEIAKMTADARMQTYRTAALRVLETLYV